MTRREALPPVHLWIYNHPLFGISDQIDFFATAFSQNGYAVTVGQEPSEAALNFVIENFSQPTRDTLINFCSSTRKRVAVVMTEHIDLESGTVLIHGDPLWSDNDYMHPATQVERLKNLMCCQAFIASFVVLGDLPELRNMADMMSGISVHSIPFPTVDLVDNRGFAPDVDLLFTGFLTEYRAALLPRLQFLGFSVHTPSQAVAHEERNALNRSARVVLNMPQRQNWRWLSLMRIIAALRCGRAAVSLGTRDTSKISECTYQLALDEPNWQDRLRAHVDDWIGSYETAHADYSRMQEAFTVERPFPHAMLEYWAITDRL